MAKDTKNTEEHTPEEEVVVEEEKGVTEKVKKLQASLKSCEKEKKEYLDGWKRAKADAVNEKHRYQERISLERIVALETHVSALLPVFDSVLSALQGENDSADTVRVGIAQLHSQFLQAFTTLGVTILNPKGEAFDPHTQQAVGQRMVEDAEQVDVVLEVARVGASVEDRVIRPAMVYVGVLKEQKSPKKNA